MPPDGGRVTVISGSKNIARYFAASLQPPVRKRPLQMRLDFLLYINVRVAGPGYVRVDIQRRPQSFTSRVRYNHTHFARDQFSTQIVWMTAYAKRQSSPLQQRVHQRTQLRDI